MGRTTRKLLCGIVVAVGLAATTAPLPAPAHAKVPPVRIDRWTHPGPFWT